jgi:hypothetical protein
MSFFIFHFFFKSRSNLVFSMINETVWVVFFYANWSDFCKIFKTMRNSIEEFTKLISLWAISSIALFETKFFVSLTTRRNVFLNFSWCFLITSDFDSNLTWKAFVCIADTNSFIDKILVLTIRLTYAYETMFRDFSLRIKWFSMFISFTALILKKIDESFSLMTKLTMICHLFFDFFANRVQ